MKKRFLLGEDHLRIPLVNAFLSRDMSIAISDDGIQRINESARYVSAIVARNEIVYGVNTGFGILADTIISEADTKTLQYKILQSHSVGVGNPVSAEIARMMLLTKANALAKGYSGVKLATIERILWHLEHNIIPVVPEKGSVGASGDLAPLAHLFLPLIGLGEVWYNGERMSSAACLQTEQLRPLELGPKEGLALINGTQFILPFAVAAVTRLHQCLEAADIIGAMSLEALTGTKAPFDERLHALRPFRGN